MYASVNYSTLQDAINIIMQLDHDIYLTKSDIKLAFRLIPIHPTEYHLFSLKHNGKYFVDVSTNVMLVELSHFPRICDSSQVDPPK